MEEVGIRELKRRTSEIVRSVRELGETYPITYRGWVVARVVPVETPEIPKAEAMAIWARMDKLAREISDLCPSDVSAAEAVTDAHHEYSYIGQTMH